MKYFILSEILPAGQMRSLIVKAKNKAEAQDKVEAYGSWTRVEEVVKDVTAV